jgi:hypothetical protein
MFATVAVLTSAIFDFEVGLVAVAGVIGGVVTDLLLGWLRPSAQRPAATRAVAAVVPAALWLPYFALVAMRYRLGWSLELWAGSVMLASMAGLALGLLAALPSAPARPRHGGLR